MQPNLAAVDFLAQARDKRAEQQDDARKHERVFVVGNFVQVAEQKQHCNHAANAYEQPHHLALRHVGRVGERGDARDEGNADARKRERKRQQRRVGAGGELAHGKMRHHESGEDADGHAQRIEVDLLAFVDGDHHEQQGHHGSGHQQQDEFYVATGHGGLSFRLVVLRRLVAVLLHQVVCGVKRVYANAVL